MPARGGGERPKHAAEKQDSLRQLGYHSDHNLASAVLPIYRRWVARYGALEAWPIHWDKNVLRWYDDLGFVEPPDAVMMYSRPHEPRLLVPGPEITRTENPPRKSG